jgi:hypothetical protein
VEPQKATRGKMTVCERITVALVWVRVMLHPGFLVAFVGQGTLKIMLRGHGLLAGFVDTLGCRMYDSVRKTKNLVPRKACRESQEKVTGRVPTHQHFATGGFPWLHTTSLIIRPHREPTLISSVNWAETWHEVIISAGPTSCVR